MTPQELRELATRAGVSVHELTSAAMRAYMVADPTNPRHGLAWDVWQVGQQVEAQDTAARMDAEGWIFYTRDSISTPMCCPNGHEANLTGGKHPVWTCRVCDMTQIGYEEQGADGYYLRWQVIH